jgi:hypothetical protein
MQPTHECSTCGVQAVAAGCMVSVQRCAYEDFREKLSGSQNYPIKLSKSSSGSMRSFAHTVAELQN